MGVRFLLCVLVVFIHNKTTGVNFQDQVVALDIPIALKIAHLFIPDYLANIAVPLFFFMSSYLLFKKDDPYPVLLKKKIRSLFIPYVLWHTLFILFRFVAQQIPVLRQYFASVIIRELDLKGFVSLYIGGHFYGQSPSFDPFVVQLWFVRDLFLCVVFSPVIKYLIKQLPLFSLVAALLFFQSDLLYNRIRTAVFYFSLGCLAVRFNLSYKNIARIKFCDIGLLYALIVALQFYFHFSAQNAIEPLGLLNILVGSVLLLKISGRVCENERIFAALRYLAGFSFWVYAMHWECLNVIKKLWVKFLPLNGASLFVEYFGGTALCVAICLGAALLVRRIAPKVYALFAGGRA